MWVGRGTAASGSTGCHGLVVMGEHDGQDLWLGAQRKGNIERA